MRLCQLISAGAGFYSRKSARIDARILEEAGLDLRTVTVEVPSEARVEPLSSSDAVMVYGARSVPQRVIRTCPARRVFDEPVAPSLLTRLTGWSRPTLTAPVPSDASATKWLPEAVEASFFEPLERVRPSETGDDRIIGFASRGETRKFVAEIAARIARFREDIAILDDAGPSREAMTKVDLWLDPALDDSDLDGGTAEAVVSGLPVVAARTPVNAHRLDGGRLGFLVPRGDPNEFTHAILNALFKPEIAGPRLDAAKLDRQRFSRNDRAAALLEVIRHLER